MLEPPSAEMQRVHHCCGPLWKFCRSSWKLLTTPRLSHTSPFSAPNIADTTCNKKGAFSCQPHELFQEGRRHLQST